VEVKILTGDNEQLTLKICADIGIPIAGMITGAELARLTTEQLDARVDGTTVFARVSPSQKELIIDALHRKGRVVGYLGDGINDAPALTAADVGISVNNAVDVAREAADIILLEKSLAVLHNGVMEGRRTFQNTTKYMMMGLSSNFGNMFSMVVASVILPFLPLLPSQILLNNFLYDTSQVTLAGDRVDEASLRKPAHWDLGFIRRYMVRFGLVSSLFDFATFALLAGVFGLAGAAFQAGWFVESLTTQVLVVYVIRTRLLPFVQSRPSPWLVVSTLGCVAVGWIAVTLPVLRHLFAFDMLRPMVLVAIAGIVAVYLVTVELVKRSFYRRLAARP
jgi:Mg2+-importing ATPase